jgi:hypothetical protein
VRQHEIIVIIIVTSIIIIITFTAFQVSPTRLTWFPSARIMEEVT